MARALDQIISELDSVYRPQRDLYNQQLSQQDPQMEAEQKGLMAQKEDSFRQITDQANRRGMFYSGLPIAEEQRYTGQQFLPAMANLAGKYKASKDNLSETLNRLSMEQRDKGYGIQQNELAIDEQMRREAEQRRQFDEQQRTARAAADGGYSSNNNNNGDGNTDLNTELQNFLSRQYKATPNANRATQDAWVKLFMTKFGLKNEAGDPNGIWATYNNLYPWEKYSDKAKISTQSVPQFVQNAVRPPSGNGPVLDILNRR